MNASISSDRHPRVAVLGLGTMGAGMARRLLDQGFEVDVWNRSPERAEALATAGAATHEDAGRAVAEVDIVVTMLPTGDAVSEVMLGGAVIDALRPGATWVQMASASSTDSGK